MPLYAWKGVDVSGTIKHGSLFARSHDDLKKRLLEQEIGLVIAHGSYFSRRSSGLILNFFSQLASLLQAHIPVHTALTIVASTTKNSTEKSIILDCAALIEEGMPLSSALRVHNLGDELSHAVVLVGEKTGNTAGAISMLVEHLTLVNSFKQKVRTALVMPLITLCFFFIVLVVVFIGVIPRFETYFASYNAPLPRVTRIILNVSLFFRSYNGLCAVLLFIAASCALFLYLKKSHGKQLKDSFLLQIPSISAFYCAVYQARFLTSLCMLIKSDLPLAPALETIKESIAHDSFKKDAERIQTSIEAGNPLSVALKGTLFSSDETDALITIGESTGHLGDLLTHAADKARRRVYVFIDRFVLLIQPLVLLLLGSLVACLIFAIYLPLIGLTGLVC